MAAEGADRDDAGRILRETLIREGVGLVVMAAVIWYMGPGKIRVAGWLHRARQWQARKGSWIDAEAARFNSEVSRWDHEQASQPDSGPAGSGSGGG